MTRIINSRVMLPNWQQERHSLKLAFVMGILFLTALACNIPGGGSTPPPDGIIGTIQKESSDVLQNAVQVQSKNPLNQDDELRVQNGGIGLLEFGQDLRLRLFNETMAGEIEATHMESDPNSPLIIRLALFAGGFSGQLYKPGSKATFTTPGGAQIVVLGTDFFVVYDPDSKITTVGNFSGTMGVIAGGESVSLASGHFLEIPREGTPGKQQQLSFSFNEFEDRARSRKSPILALRDDSGTPVAQVSPTITSNAFETDTDQDGLVDGDESPPCPDPNDPDTDGDGLIDGRDLDPCDANNPALTATAKASIPTETPITPVPPTTQPPTDTPTPTPSPTPTATHTPTNTPTLTSTPLVSSGFITYRLQSADGTTIYLQGKTGPPIPLLQVKGDAEVLDFASHEHLGGHFAIWAEEGGEENIYIVHPDGTLEMEPLNEGWDSVVDVDWSQDGDNLIVEALAGDDYITPEPTIGDVTYYSYQIHRTYSELFLFEIFGIVPDQEVSIQTINMPPNDEFVVTMGRMGTEGVNGTPVDTVDSGKGGSKKYTFDIPGDLRSLNKLSIRMESSSSGYYAFNWFANNPRLVTGQGVSFDLNRDRIAYSGEGDFAYSICLLDSNGEDYLCPWLTIPEPEFFSFLPDGHFLVAVKSGEEWIMGIYDGEDDPEPIQGESGIDQIFLVPDTYKIKRGSEGQEWRLTPYQIRSSQDYRWMTVSSGGVKNKVEGAVNLYRAGPELQVQADIAKLNSDTFELMRARDQEDISSGLLSPDGSKIAFRTNIYQSSESYLYSLYIVDLSNGEGEPVELVSNADFKIKFDFSPDSKSLVYESNAAPARSIWIANSDGTNPRLLAANGDLPDWH